MRPVQNRPGVVVFGALLFVITGLLGGSAPARAQSGSLEFTVRATPTGGRPEPVLRLPLHLLRKSFADIRKEAEETEPAPALDAFVDKLEVSPELKAWMKRARSPQLSGPEFVRRLTTKDIFEVPEFYKAYMARNAGDDLVGFPKPKYRERDREKNPQRFEKQQQEYQQAIRKFLEANPHTVEGIDLHLAEIDPGQRWARQETERGRRVRNRTLELAGTRYLVARAETDLDGRAALAGLAPGEYWLSTLEGEAVVGDVRLRWDVRVTLRAGRATRLELSNLNAATLDPPSK